MRNLRKNTADFLDILIQDALKAVSSGYYSSEVSVDDRRSLVSSIIGCEHAPVIAEIKPASPSLGRLIYSENFVRIAKAMESGGAVGISVLTEPKHFKGSLKALVDVKRAVSIPILMKDVILDRIQLEAASRLGADAVLLIYSVLTRTGCSLKDMIEFAHSNGMEVLLEVQDPEEFRAAVRSHADLVGINNRDLRTLRVDLNRTKEILGKVDPSEKIVVSESGIKSAEDIRFLRKCGAKAFLVGSAIMLAENVEGKVRELVTAL
ncbi:MAG: indole-3-glycerol-phosphate synthase [Candidatus Korarchaeum sp.]